MGDGTNQSPRSWITLDARAQNSTHSDKAAYRALAASEVGAYLSLSQAHLVNRFRVCRHRSQCLRVGWGQFWLQESRRGGRPHARQDFNFHWHEAHVIREQARSKFKLVYWYFAEPMNLEKCSHHIWTVVNSLTLTLAGMVFLKFPKFSIRQSNCFFLYVQNDSLSVACFFVR